MSKVTVIGGAGTVGAVAVRTLAAAEYFSEIVIADANVEQGKIVARENGPDNISVVQVNAEDPASIKEAIAGSDVVCNTVGPFYKFGPIILKAAIESGINYVDVCDDFDATEAMLPMDAAAKAAGVSALIGMGSSPGLGNVLIRFCIETMLDEAEAVDIYHAHGGEPSEGPAVVKHRIHSMLLDIPVFLDGKATKVKLFEESGKALEEVTEFKNVGTYLCYAYPHPETMTLPMYYKSLKRVTNLGLVLPPDYAELIKGVVRLGMVNEEPLSVQGCDVAPLEFAVTYILSQRQRLMDEADLNVPQGCLKIVIKGTKGGKPHTYVFSLSSRGQGMGEGTGIPAALGAILMAQGKIPEKGCFPPEGGVKPLEILELATKVLKGFEGGGEGLPVSVDHIDPDGNVESMDLKF